MKKSDQKIRQFIWVLFCLCILAWLGINSPLVHAQDDFNNLIIALESLKPKYENCRNCNIEKNDLFKFGEEVLNETDNKGGYVLESEQRLNLASLLGELQRISEEANAKSEELTTTEDEKLNAKTKELEGKVEELGNAMKAMAPLLANMLGGGAKSVGEESDEKKGELKEMHSQVREAARRAWQSNVTAAANVRRKITTYERKLKSLERARAGESTVANQARENVEELKKTLVALEQRKGEIILRKRDADIEYDKSARKPSSGVLAFFTPDEVMQELNYKKMKKSADILDEISNDLADLEAYASSVEAVAGGEGGAQDFQAIDGWLAVYAKKNQEASPNPVVYDPGLTRPGGSYRDNSFLLPAFKGPKSVNGREI